MRHRLSNIDPDTRDAVCSECGPVRAVRKGVTNGRQKWACETVRARHTYGNGHGMKRADMLRAKEGARCSICGDDQKLVIDHCHDTGALRGVLCNDCNAGIGFLGDSIFRLEQALAYLKNPPGVIDEDPSPRSQARSV